MNNSILIHLFPTHPFSNPRKHQKTLRFSDVFRKYRKGALGTNGLISFVIPVYISSEGRKQLGFSTNKKVSAYINCFSIDFF